MGITGQPAYQQIAHDLRRKIADGVYQVGEAIPATNQLMSLYHGSITVVRAAIRELQNEGVLIGQPGKGVYVQRVPTADEVSHRPDTYGRVIELETAVRELTDRLGDGVTDDLVDIRRQLGVMQGQIRELYGRMGMPYSHEAARPQEMHEQIRQQAERAIEGALLSQVVDGGALIHFTADGTRVFTIAEAAALTGKQPAAYRKQVERKKVEPAGRINAREAVYTAAQLGMDPALAPKVIGPADAQRLYDQLVELVEAKAPWMTWMKVVEDFFVEMGMRTILYR